MGPGCHYSLDWTTGLEFFLFWTRFCGFQIFDTWRPQLSIEYYNVNNTITDFMDSIVVLLAFSNTLLANKYVRILANNNSLGII